ncbi:MAG: hypothetical protein KF817_04285 [Phycisphaeraceae bacterium]|nr:hypothetical protein [Phycisphaeraceae bacterium]
MPAQWQALAIPLVLLVVAAAVIVMAVMHHRRQAAERRRIRQGLAPELSMTFLEEAPDLAVTDKARVGGLAHGRAPKMCDVLSGTVADLRVYVGDFSTVVQSGKSAARIAQTVAIIEVPGTRLPEFRVSTETILHRLGSALGMQDIDFDAYPEFSRTRSLRGPDEAAIRACFTPEVVEAIERFDRETTVESIGHRLLVYRRRRVIMRGEEISALLTDAVALAVELLQAAPVAQSEEPEDR